MTTSSLQFHPAQLAAELESDNDEFRQALDDIALEERKAEATLEAKRARLEETERIHRACARIYEGFFLLADRADLLERLRRALRRRTRRGTSSTDHVPPVPDVVPPPDGESPQDSEPFEGEPLKAASSDD